MIDDILAQIFGQALFGRGGDSTRAQLIGRLFFGLLGAGLCGVGAVVFYQRGIGRHTPTSASMIAMFVFLACFSLLNVALGRKWRWPGVMFVVTFVVMFLSAVIAGGQSVSPTGLSSDLRAHVQAERFQIVTSIRGLPLGVRDGLQTLFRSKTLDIAERGAKFQVDDVVIDPDVPIRRLVAAGCSYDRCLIYYERGGGSHTWHVALFHWTPAATRFEWGGTAPRGLRTIEDVRKAILSGTVKGPTSIW